MKKKEEEKKKKEEEKKKNEAAGASEGGSSSIDLPDDHKDGEYRVSALIFQVTKQANGSTLYDSALLSLHPLISLVKFIIVVM